MTKTIISRILIFFIFISIIPIAFFLLRVKVGFAIFKTLPLFHTFHLFYSSPILLLSGFLLLNTSAKKPDKIVAYTALLVAISWPIYIYIFTEF